jgi:hypothetical protein
VARECSTCDLFTAVAKVGELGVDDTSGGGNRFTDFGNGWTSKELDETSDITPYLKKPEEPDLRDHHERLVGFVIVVGGRICVEVL